MPAPACSDSHSRCIRTVAVGCALLLPVFVLPAWAQIQTAIPTPTATSPQEMTDSEVVAPEVTPTPSQPETQPDDDEKPKAKRFQLGGEVGLFVPTSQRTKNRFGDSKFSVGIGFTPLRDPQEQGKFGLDLKLYYLERGNNRAIFVPLGVDYSRAFARTETIAPYVGASANLYPASLRVPLDGIDSDLKLGYGGSVFTGLVWKRKFYMEARYMGVSRIQGFNLSGFNFSAGFRF